MIVPCPLRQRRIRARRKARIIFYAVSMILLWPLL